MKELEDNVVSYPALHRLRALLPEGLDSVHRTVRIALEGDDLSEALRRANQRYARRGLTDYVAVMTYACLLVGRELVVEARGLLEKARAEFGDDAGVLALLADASVLAGDFERAEEHLSDIDQGAVERPEVLAFVADTWLDLGDEDEAIAWYEAAVDAGIEDAEAAIRLGQMYVARDQPRPAAEAFDYAARHAGGRTGLWQMTSDLWFEIGEDVAGMKARQRVLELGEAEADEWLELGLAYAQLGALDDALEALQEAEKIKFDPFDVDPLLAQGHIYLQMGQAEEALARFRNVLKLEKDQVGALAGIASAALLIGDLGLAEDRAKRAVELAPEDAEAHHTLGVVMQQFGRHERAVEHLERALDLDGDQPRFYGSLALSLVALDRLDEAREQLDHVLDRDPAEGAYSAADYALALLKKGEVDRVQDLIDEIDLGTPEWVLLSDLLGFLVGAVQDEDDLGARVQRFRHDAEAHADALPLYLDEDQWHRLGRAFPEEARDGFERMLDVLQGRVGPEEFGQ